MKKVFIIALFACAAMTVANGVYGQESVKNRVGFQVLIASGDYDEIGVGAVGEFKVAKKVTISPQLNFYFPEEDVSLFELNGNVNYYFYNQDIFEFYGLAGLNLTRLRVDYDGRRDNYTNTELGLNLGGGINFEIQKKFVPFSELRFTVGEYDQLVVSVGMKFNLR